MCSSGLSVNVSPGRSGRAAGPQWRGQVHFHEGARWKVAGSGGARTEPRDLRIGYFAQHQLEQLDASESPLGHLRRFGGDRAARLTEQQLRDFLAGFGFRGDRVFEPAAPFSGGEKARLVLALLAFQRPNLLLLDEPTNHLDLEMRQALAVRCRIMRARSCWSRTIAICYARSPTSS